MVVPVLSYSIISTYCTGPLLSPPLLRPTSRKKRGGITTRTCAFASQLSPPLPRIHVLRSMKLCCVVEAKNSYDRHAVAVLKDGRPRPCCHFFCKTWQVVLQPDSSHRPRRQDDGLRKPSEISEKGQDQFSNYFLHA